MPWNGHLFYSTFVLGGGGNVTFPGIGFPANTFIGNIVCTSGPPRSDVFRWSWCRVLYNWRERWTRPLEHASLNRPVYTVISVMPDV